MIDQATFAAALLLWGVLPGLALLATVKIDWTPVERIAAAPGLSIALVAFAAYAAEAIGLPVSPLPVAAIIVAICAAVLIARRVRPSSSKPSSLQASKPSSPQAFKPSRLQAFLPWLLLLLPQVIVGQLEPISTVTLLPPSLHDGLDHANWFRLILETRSLAPHEVMAPPFSAPGTPAYYPWGLHGWLALVAQTTTLDPVAVLMRTLVLISASLPLSVYAFVAMFVGRGWPAIAAAALSLLFWWLPYQAWGWGGYPLLAGAVAALPFSRLALVAVDTRSVAGIGAASACAVGLLFVHPSQAFAALVIATTVSLTLAAARVVPLRTAAPFVLLLALAAIALTAGKTAWAPLDAFVAQSARIGATLADDARFAWPLDLYLDNDLARPTVVRVVMGGLYIVGAVYAGAVSAARPLLVLHVVLSLLIPAARGQTWITTFWYHSPERLWYAQCAVMPALAALGVTAIVRGLQQAVRRWRTIAPLIPWLAWPAALWAISAFVYQPFAAWADLKLFQMAQRNPNQTITDRRILADYRWIDTNVPAGAVLFNAPADWGLPLPFTGRRTTFWSGGHAMDPVTPWYELLEWLRRGDPLASQAAAELRALGIHYVYAAALGPVLEGDRQALSAQTLKNTSRLQLRYESPTAAVFEIPDEGSMLLGVDDSDRVQYLGFHAVERRFGRSWRWTVGDGRVRIKTGALPSGDCAIRIHGSDPGHYFFRVDGTEFPFTAEGYHVPASHRAADVLELLIRVPDALRRAQGDGAAARTVGVRVTNVELRCG
jgi:hypothetical protein